MSASIQCCVLRMLCVFCCTVSFTFQSIIVINFGTPRLYENVFRHYELSDPTSHLQFCTSLRSDGRHSVVPKVKSIETIMRSCHSALSARLGGIHADQGDDRQSGNGHMRLPGGIARQRGEGNLPPLALGSPAIFS